MKQNTKGTILGVLTLSFMLLVSVSVSGCDTQQPQSVLVEDEKIRVYDIYETYKELVFTTSTTVDLQSLGSNCFVQGRKLPCTCEYLDNLISKSKGE